MTHEQIEYVEIQLQGMERLASGPDTDELTFEGTPQLYGAIINLILFILQFAKENTISPDGSPKKIKWFDFLFNKNLRDFVGAVIGKVIDLVKGVFFAK